jgi:hypothetical protein
VPSPGHSPKHRRAPRSRSSRLADLRVVPDTDGPYVRLGIAWAGLTVLAAIASPIVLGLWMAGHAGLAAAQAARSHRPHVNPLAAAAGAALVPLGCAFGWTGAAAGLVLGTVACLGLELAVPRTGRAAGRGRVVVIALVLGSAAGSLVLARSIGLVPALFLLALVGAYDAGAYLVGTGAGSAWEGPAAGIAAMGPVTLAAATVSVPPFTETGPWILGAIAAVLTPLGPYAGSALTGPSTSTTRLPALRRLDSLIVVGPVWVAAASILTQ